MILLKIFFSTFLIFLVNAQCRQAEDNRVGDLCYSFSLDRMNFNDSRKFCHLKNQNLAIIHTLSQNSWLAHLVNTRSTVSNPKFWIGLSRLTVNSPFIWDDGTPLTWSNLGPLKDSLYGAENTANSKWETLDGSQKLDFVCSYNPSSVWSTDPSPTTVRIPTTTVPLTTVAPTTTTRPKPSVTCLFMVDMQSAGIDAAAITAYNNYFNFAQLVAGKLNNQAEFTGYLDNFGYNAGLADHDTYPTDSYIDFANIPFPVDGTNDDIDLDLKDTDSLASAVWEPPVKDQTCLIFISAAPKALYGGTTIQTTYPSFTTVIGVLVGGATSIPGLTDPIAASTLSDGDAEAVVQKLLETLPYYFF